MTIHLKKKQEVKSWGALRGDYSEKTQSFRGEVDQSTTREGRGP